MDDAKAVKLGNNETLEEVESVNEPKFTAEMQGLIASAEEFRLEKMRQHSGRNSLSLILGLSAVMVGSGIFGWYFLVDVHALYAFLGLAAAVLIPIKLNFWAKAPLLQYRREFKSRFMPAIAKALGGLRFHPKRGISAKTLSRTGILPPYDSYEAEDCFIGQYHGVKIIFSEARLHQKQSEDPIFDGIFVLLELPQETFAGTTVITADHKMAKALSSKLQTVNVKANSASAAAMHVLSNAPEHIEKLKIEPLLKELYEMVVLFDQAALSAVFFKNRYVFMMIPYDVDMFECSNVFLPVTTQSTALQCKKEIDQIMSIIDVLEIYQK